MSLHLLRRGQAIQAAAATLVSAGLILATLLTFGEFRRFPMLAAAIQALALVTVLSFQGLAGRWGFAETDRRPRGVWARSADIVVAIAVVVAVATTASSLTRLPLSRSLERDACLDAGGRMSVEGVCEYGPLGPN